MVGKNRTSKLHTLDSPIGYCCPRQKLSERVSAGNPAIDVMTDLEYVAALTIGLNVTIDDALELMTKGGVRLLFVANESGMVSGLVTANDIQGEKPMKVLHEVGGKHSGILVRDVMTPWGRLEVLQMDDVIKASVGDIIATLKQAGRQHALVVDTDEKCNKMRIRGIFSIAKIGTQLGIPIDTTGKAYTFSELEQALGA